MKYQTISRTPKIIIKRKVRYGEFSYDFYSSAYTLLEPARQQIGAILLQYKVPGKPFGKGFFIAGRISGCCFHIPLINFDEFLEKAKAILLNKTNWVEELCPWCNQPITKCPHFGGRDIKQ